MLNFSDNVINNGGRLRTVLDVGCGVASFGGTFSHPMSLLCPWHVMLFIKIKYRLDWKDEPLLILVF